MSDVAIMADRAPDGILDLGKNVNVDVVDALTTTTTATLLPLSNEPRSPLDLDADDDLGRENASACADALLMGQRRKGLTSIINQLRMHKRRSCRSHKDISRQTMCFGVSSDSSYPEDDALTQQQQQQSQYHRNMQENGDANVTREPPSINEVETPTTPISKQRRRERAVATALTSPGDYHHSSINNNNNNNNVKNERLSPGTTDTSSRSVTPSSASHPNTPPAENPMLQLTGRNYSDFMRSLAAKYQNANPNEYFARNGFPPPLDPRFKPNFSLLNPSVVQNVKDEMTKNKDLASSMLLNPFATTSMFPPLIDMSSTQTLLAMVRTAKEAELQGLLKNVKRTESSSPLDLSAAAPPNKRPRLKTPIPKRAQSESPKLVGGQNGHSHQHVAAEDVSSWSVEDVCAFVGSIDICAEYVQNFKDQRIDGSGLPLLTEEHLTSTMHMKLGPALKLRSMLAKKLGSCSVCLHCTHCHNSGAAANNPANSSALTSSTSATSPDSNTETSAHS